MSTRRGRGTLTLGGYSAWITVNEQELPVFNVEHGKQATCWIPSEENQNFVINWKDSVRNMTTSCILYIDGVRCPGGVHIYALSHKNGPRRPDTKTIKGIKSSSSTMRPFVFAKHELTDVDDDNTLRASTGDLGEIKLQLNEVDLGAYRLPSRKVESVALPGSLKLHETCKKGIEHGVILGDTCHVRPNRTLKSRKIQSLVSLVFRYRPMALLQANDIAPLAHKVTSHKRSSTVLKIDEYESGPSKIRRLEDELRLAKEQENQKRRKSGGRKEIEPRLKTERNLVQLGDIIDLT